MSQLPYIIDLATENQQVELSRPQLSPAKIKDLGKFKKLTKPKKSVSFPDSVLADKIMSTTQTVTSAQDSDKLTLQIATKIIADHLDNLEQSKIFPLPAWFKLELLNDHVLTDLEIKNLEDQVGNVFFPFLQLNDDEYLILFLNTHINSKHVLGQKLLELVKLVKSTTKSIFVEKVDDIVKFLTGYLQNTFQKT